MELNIPGVSPALLSESAAAVAAGASTILFRHAYSADLDPHKVVRLAAMAAPLRRAFTRKAVSVLRKPRLRCREAR